MASSTRFGALLVQLGTPDSPSVGDVRRYLREFLGDPKVLDLPAPLRWLLLYGVILPRRPKLSAEAYRAIWRPEGSPLLLHSRALHEGVAAALGDGFHVELGMRYGNPSLRGALERLAAAELARVVVLPLFPQYADSTTASAVEQVRRLARRVPQLPELVTVPAFHDDPAFLAAVCAQARPVLERFRPDHVLLSYHGLPERQVRKADPSGRHCLAREDCCEALEDVNGYCYRAQCFATSRAIRAELGLGGDRATTSFQSRLGRTPWIRPYTDHVLAELAARGVRRLAILCPSFVADCLETLEEIGIRGRDQWHALGGEALEVVPCVNASPQWVAAAADLIRRASRGAAERPSQRLAT